MNKLLSAVCQDEDSAASGSPSLAKKHNNRRGSNRRESHSVKLKVEVIYDYEAGDMSQDSIAEKYKINRSLVSKWVKNKDKIIAAAAESHKKLLKIRPGTKYCRLYSVLFRKFKDASSKGHSIDFNWLWCKARILYREITGNPDATVRQHVVVSFLKRYNVRMRTRQRNQKATKSHFEADLKKWHATTREKLIRTGRNDAYDEKWGRYKPTQRFNVDQSPLPFALNTTKTYEHIDKGVQQHDHKVHISQPGSGLDKRQCSLQVTVRAEGEQPRLAIIFRGSGKRISNDEKAAYDKNIDVFFQENAWADTKVSIEWVEKTLSKATEGQDRFVLFCDNLTAQVSDEFKQAVSNLGGVVWYGLPNATDLWQPIDAGYAQLLKSLIGQAQRKWLDDEDNADKWYGLDKSFTAKERRILITHWCGLAYRRLIRSEYNHMRLRVWQKTGCLMTANGSDDDAIKSEGLPNYEVPPPAVYLEPAATSPQTADNTVEPQEDQDMEVELDGQEDPEKQPEPEQECLEDKQEDRDFNAELVGRHITALYENGWFSGVIEYYNKELREYKVNYPDETSDFITTDDIDGVEVILEN